MCQAHDMLGTQRGRPFPGLRESGVTGLAGSTRPPAETQKENPGAACLGSWPSPRHLSTLCSAPQSVKSTSLLVINYHLSHCSQNEILLLCFSLSTNALQASSHNHWSLLLGQCPLSSTAGMAHLPLLAIFTTLSSYSRQCSSYSRQCSWIKSSLGNHCTANIITCLKTPSCPANTRCNSTRTSAVVEKLNKQLRLLPPTHTKKLWTEGEQRLLALLQICLCSVETYQDFCWHVAA